MRYLKYYPRLNIYKNSTESLKYDPVKQIAYSFKWYEIYKIINGVRCLNTHGYSVTTAKHVSKLWQHFQYGNFPGVQTKYRAHARPVRGL